MITVLPIPKLHKEFCNWMIDLNFYQQEIIIFEFFLDNILYRNKAKEIEAKVNGYRDRFFLLKQKIYKLKVQLNETQTVLVLYVQQVSGLGLESIHMDNHADLREDIDKFVKAYEVAKNDFRNFKSKWG